MSNYQTRYNEMARTDPQLLHEQISAALSSESSFIRIVEFLLQVADARLGGSQLAGQQSCRVELCFVPLHLQLQRIILLLF